MNKRFWVLIKTTGSGGKTMSFFEDDICEPPFTSHHHRRGKGAAGLRWALPPRLNAGRPPGWETTQVLEQLQEDFRIDLTLSNLTSFR